MAILNLVNQLSISNEIRSKLLQIKSPMNARKKLWEKLSIEQRKKWIVSEKDPIMNIAWSIYKYLDINFFKDVNDEV